MKVKIGDYGKDQKVKIRIDDYDLWNLDITLAMIILPALKKIKKNKYGAPWVKDKDVPKKLRRPKGTKPWDQDKQYFERWDYVLDEMIFAFEHIIKQDNTLYKGPEDLKKINKRIQNGLRLFGKYYRALWI